MSALKISVIIPTYNRRKSLSRCLEKVLAQDHPAHEILVVDDGSTDGTSPAIRDAYPQVRVLRGERNLGPAAARNRGIAAASGSILAFTDDDCLVPQDWLRRHLRYYEDPSIGAVGGPQVPRAPNFFDKVLMSHYHDLFFRSLRKIETLSPMDALWTNNLSVRRIVIDDVGLFDEAFRTGSDTEFTRRVNRVGGYTLISDPELQVEHLRIWTLTSWLKIRFQRGCGVVLQDIKEGSVRLQSFVPVPNFGRAYVTWKTYRAKYRGGPSDFTKFFALLLLTRWAEVTGRAYYLWKDGRRYRRQRPQVN